MPRSSSQRARHSRFRPTLKISQSNRGRRAGGFQWPPQAHAPPQAQPPPVEVTPPSELWEKLANTEINRFERTLPHSGHVTESASSWRVSFSKLARQSAQRYSYSGTNHL